MAPPQPELKKVHAEQSFFYVMIYHARRASARPAATFNPPRRSRGLANRLLPQYLDKRLFVQLNGSRKVTGTLRGYDVRNMRTRK